MLSSRITSTPSNFEKRADLIEIIGFHLDPEAGSLLAHPLDRCAKLRKPIARQKVVVFHQHHVEEAEAMIRPAARDDRRLLKPAQARRRLARVENLAPLGPAASTN